MLFMPVGALLMCFILFMILTTFPTNPGLNSVWSLSLLTNYRILLNTDSGNNNKIKLSFVSIEAAAVIGYCF